MKIIFIFIITQIILLSNVIAESKLNVFACEPEWSALAKEIGGEKIKTFSATTSKQNPHHIRARPSLISKIRRADLLICSGAGLEIGWLPILLQKASANVQANAIGHITASNFVEIIEIPDHVDRSLGDIHPEGNPHIHLNPHNILLVAEAVYKRLLIINPDNASYYNKQFEMFNTKWKEAIIRWEKSAAELKNKPIMVHHKSFSYLIDWLKLKQIASLEPRPGMPPTSSHLNELLIIVNKSPIDIIIRTPYDSSKASEWMTEKTNIPNVILPYTVNEDDINNLYKLFDRTIFILNNH
tara:strand:+ start:3873 stop:4766 length:894 start_codon:yes stop_codon:yes gene_type:complete